MSEHRFFNQDRKELPKKIELIESIEAVVKQGISIIFIDYFQVLTGIRTGDVYQESSKMINELKLFANLNNVAIVLSSQLSRKVEERQGHRQ